MCTRKTKDLALQIGLAIMHDREVQAGFMKMEHYSVFGEQVKETKRKLLDFLIKAKREGKKIAGYGAPGKGNTLLNYCGIREDFLDYTVDRNPYKQGKYLPEHIFLFTRPKRLMKHILIIFSFFHGISKMKLWNRWLISVNGADNLSCLFPKYVYMLAGLDNRKFIFTNIMRL